MGKRTQAGGARETGGKKGKRSRPKGGWKTNRLEAMAHPLRARVLRILAERGVMSPAELSREMGADLSNVSYHVRQLVKLKCVEEVRTRPVRGALEHFYRAVERPMVDADEFEELDPVNAEDLVLDCIQRVLDDFVASRKAKLVGFDGNCHLSRTPLVFDEEGFEEGMTALERCRLEMSEIERRSAERRTESGGVAVPVSSNILFFKVPRKSLET